MTVTNIIDGKFDTIGSHCLSALLEITWVRDDFALTDFKAVFPAVSLDAHQFKQSA